MDAVKDIERGRVPAAILPNPLWQALGPGCVLGAMHGANASAMHALRLRSSRRLRAQSDHLTPCAQDASG
jgi:hypothetical protein